MREGGEGSSAGVLEKPPTPAEPVPPKNSTPLIKKGSFLQEAASRAAGNVSPEEQALRDLVAGEQNKTAEQKMSVITEMVDLAGIKLEDLSPEIQRELASLELEPMEVSEFAQRAKALFPKIKSELSEKDELGPERQKHLDSWQQMIETEAASPENLMRVLRARSVNLPQDQQQEATGHMKFLEEENMKPDKAKDWKSIRERGFKLGKLFGIGALLMMVMTIWRAFKSMSGGGHARGPAG